MTDRNTPPIERLEETFYEVVEKYDLAKPVLCMRTGDQPKVLLISGGQDPKAVIAQLARQGMRCDEARLCFEAWVRSVASDGDDEHLAEAAITVTVSPIHTDVKVRPFVRTSSGVRWFDDRIEHPRADGSPVVAAIQQLLHWTRADMS